MIRPDAIIEDGQQLTAGETYQLAVDFVEIDGEAFTISSATVTFYNLDDEVVSTLLTDVSASVSTGNLSGEVRLKALLSSVAMDIASGDYFAIWDLTLGDSQTRRVKQAIKVRSLP